jgi:predicted nucleic acid-binding protein
MPQLLEVNVLLAAIWTGHPQHAGAEGRLAGKSLAVCALTELGFMRVTHAVSIAAPFGESSGRAGRLFPAHDLRTHPGFAQELRTRPPANPDRRGVCGWRDSCF